MGTLPEQIDLARAALGPDGAYKRRGVTTVVVPRADIEVDVDMENVEQGVYLWGALVFDRTDVSASPRYTAFATWEPLDPDVELENSLRFWEWLSVLRSQAEQSGRSFKAYCYNAPAENTYLRRLGVAGGLLEEVATFIRSDQWVDLLQVVGANLITGSGLGLKKIAPLAGYTWGVDEPGGGASMLRYDEAVDGDAAARERARAWLLAYNQGDVEATLAVREWLAREGDQLPSIESLDSMFAEEGPRSKVLGSAP
jgi:predicted RecB family nuclease